MMAYDEPGGAEQLPLQAAQRRRPRQRIHLEMDKLTPVAWPPASVARGGATHTLESIYALAGISQARDQHEGNIADLHPGAAYTDAGFDAFRDAHMNHPPAAPGPWHMYGAFLTSHVEGILGIMF
ncbi:MAG: hypothetical protein WKF75_00685 [Singulisphaera sp.]